MADVENNIAYCPVAAPPGQYDERQYDDSICGGDKTCRICLGTDRPEEMIAPCYCKGTQKYVHRGCLDQWRYTKEDRAFSKCTECHFEYRMHMNPDVSSGYRKMKYRFLVTRDFLLILLVVQASICFLAWFIRGIDTSGCEGQGWGFSNSHKPEETCDHDEAFSNATDHKHLVCGELRRTLLCWCAIAPYDKTSYYLFGMICFFACIGFGAMCVGLTTQMGCCDTCNHGDCYWCLWCDCDYNCRHVHCDCPCAGCDCSGLCNGGCGNCNCGDCKGGGDGAAVILVVLAVVCIIMALVGLIVAIIFFAAAVQTIMQRHMHVLQKREYTRSYLVADLDGLDVVAMPRSYEPEQYALLCNPVVTEGLPTIEVPVAYAPKPPMPSAPPMSKDEMTELMDAGLM